jgi:hypothetical protein
MVEMTTFCPLYHLSYINIYKEHHKTIVLHSTYHQDLPHWHHTVEYTGTLTKENIPFPMKETKSGEHLVLNHIKYNAQIADVSSTK